MIDWKNVNGFSKAEFAPAKDKEGDVLTDTTLCYLNESWDMHPCLIGKAQELRSKPNEYHATRIIVSKNGGFAYTGHADHSLHYCLFEESVKSNNNVDIGRAMDFHYKNIVGLWPWYEAAMFTWKHIDERFGLGFYPYSNTGFVHLDYRKDVEGRHPAVWWRDKNGKYRTYPFYQFPLAIKEAFDEINNSNPA